MTAPNAEYACLDCEFETDSEAAMNDHIDEAHNEGYGLQNADSVFGPKAFLDEVAAMPTPAEYLVRCGDAMDAAQLERTLDAMISAARRIQIDRSGAQS